VDGTARIGRIYGHEKNIMTYNLARMNMLLHGVALLPVVQYENHPGGLASPGPLDRELDFVGGAGLF